MERTDVAVVGRCFGTAVLGPRGQLVIPVKARKELGMDTGDRFLVFGHLGGLGLILIQVEAAEKVLNIVSSRIDEVAKLVKESKATTPVRKGRKENQR